MIGDQGDVGDVATWRRGDGEWFSFSSRLPVFSRPPALRFGQYAEGYVLQYAVADDQQAFLAEFSRDRAEDHLAQFGRGLIEFGLLPGLPSVLLLNRFAFMRLIA